MPVIDLIQARRGTAAAWTAGNPVLAAGEEGFELDTGKFKIGDGVTAWAGLDHFINEAALSSAYVGVTGGRVRSQVATDGTDQAATLTAEMAALAAAGGGELLLPEGIVDLAALELIDSVDLVGVGKERTVLRAHASSTADGLVMLDAGPVRARLRHLEVRGNGIADQHGIYLEAQGSGGSPDHGGWWNSGLDNVMVRDFDGDQIWLRGGGTDALKPHQFLTFKDVESYTDGTRAALRMTGQVGQVELIGHCQFDGPGQANDGTNIFIGREVDDDLDVVSDIAPYSIKFRGATTQDNRRGLFIERARPVTWDGGYLENLSLGVDASAAADLVIIKDALFTNVGVFAGAGYAVASRSGCSVVVESCYFGGSSDKHLLSVEGNLIARDNVGPAAGLTTEGLTHNLGIAGGGTLTTAFYTTVLVNTSATELHTITSGLSPGERLSLKAWGGSIVLGAGGNIHVSGLTFPLTVPANALVTLVRYDLGAVWNVESITPA